MINGELIVDNFAGDGHFGEVRAFLIKYYGDATG